MIKAWYDKNFGHMVGGAKKHAENVSATLQTVGTAVVTAGALGYADAHLASGLDYTVTGKAQTGSTGAVPTYHIPLDGALGGLGIVGGLLGGLGSFGPTARDVCATGLAVFTFRKARDYSASKMRQAGQVPGYQTQQSFVNTMAAAPAATAHGEAPFLPAYGNAANLTRFAGEQEDPIVVAARAL